MAKVKYLYVSVHAVLLVQVVDCRHDILDYCNALIQRSVFPVLVQPVLERVRLAQFHANVQVRNVVR